MKRQWIALGVVALSLSVLYGAGSLWECAKRTWTEVMPGGFVVSYFANEDFHPVLACRAERHAFRDYGRGRPARGVGNGHYAARWEGWLIVPEAGEYSLFLQAVSGAKVYLDDALVIDRWESQKWRAGTHAREYLEKRVYQIRIDYRKKDGDSGALRLRWAGGPVAPNTVMGVPYVTKKDPRLEH